ncbi:hypothetical protein L873DRAFT_32097 [Choiromyces venosus 120613-1]|uniref:Uncharacterized protein n=1 Tax=Choiromyces venosus 120613-1 TaxID=1336337 RepID=A0A3N4K6P7_9PEZI|nr:hypothetical protein L873DRAFT_32097 [Choiromyces venosus 120613-1]
MSDHIQLLEQAVQATKDANANGYQQGYERGYQDGYRQALQKMRHFTQMELARDIRVPGTPVPTETAEAPRATRATPTRVLPVLLDVAGFWTRAEGQTGKKRAVTRGMYINGDIVVDGRKARTVPREPKCETCERHRRDCVVPANDEPMIRGSTCGWCVKAAKRCN